jgi:hypothetical protein
MLKKIKMYETRGEGRKSNIKRAYTLQEFEKIVELFRRCADFEHHFKYVTMSLLCKHLIHRVDDTCHLRLDAPHSHREYDFAIRTRTKWSKNVTSFADCPPQILLASNTWKDCILLHLGSYLEAWIASNINVVYLFAEDRDEKAPSRLKGKYKKRLQQVCYVNDEFKALYDQVGDDEDRLQGLGGHSCRKFAGEYAKKKGCAVKDIEYRG